MLTEALRQWRDFYALGGTAAATLVGLMFVAASIGAGVFTRAHQVGIRSFLSPTVVHFSAVLMIGLAASAPNVAWTTPAVIVIGLSGLAYGSWVLWRMGRHGITSTIDVIDRLWYTFFPIVAYLVVLSGGFRLWTRHADGLNELAVGLVFLLVIGLRNAWDMMVWIIDRHGQASQTNRDTQS
jgi:hypothetical protein